MSPPLTAGVGGPAAGRVAGRPCVSAWCYPTQSGTASLRMRTHPFAPLRLPHVAVGWRSKLFEQEQELKMSLMQGAWPLEKGRKNPKTSHKEEMEMTKTQPRAPLVPLSCGEGTGELRCPWAGGLFTAPFSLPMFPTLGTFSQRFHIHRFFS